MKYLSPCLLLLVLALAACEHRGCFTSGTLIDTPKGKVPIESLQVGDEVYGFDLQNQTMTVERVLSVFVHKDVHVRTMLLKNGNTLNVSDEHPIYTTEGYRNAGELSTGETLMMRGIEPVLVAQWTEKREVDAVYNFEVSGHHNYFANGLLVHNKSPLPPDANLSADSDVDAEADGGEDATPDSDE